VRTHLIVTVALVASTASAFAMPSSQAAPAASPTFGVTWTADSSGNSLAAYAPGASGSATPIATISGHATGLHAPSAVAISSTGKLFVANAGNDSITEYAADATGNASPTATISGTKTGLDGPSSIVLSAGQLWVTDPDSNLVESFSVSSTGNALPAQTISGRKTLLEHPVALALDSDVLPEVTVVNNPPTGKASIVSYFAGTPGNVAPETVLVGTPKHKLVSPTAIMPGTGGKYWITDSGTNSLFQIFFLPGLPVLDVRHVVTGSATGLDDPTGLSHDALGRVVVANAGDHTVRVFGSKADGNAKPLRTLATTASGSLAAATVFGAAPGAPTGLKVKRHKGSASLHWKAPAVTGGGLLGYDVLALRDDDFGLGGLGELGGLLGVGGGIGELFSELGLISEHPTTTKTHFTKHIKPGHRYLFIVVAINGFGASHLSNHVTTAHVIPPSPPRKVKAFAGAHSLLVKWRQPKQAGGAAIKAFRVQYAAGCVPGTKGCKASSQVASRYSDTVRIPHLKAKTTYDVRVIARNKSGPGTPSRVAKATTS
jgi:hypothetical protein